MDPDDDLDRGEKVDADLEAFDEYNDDTFGAAADAWDEDGHEELAKMTEEELHGVSASNDFFDLDNNGDANDFFDLDNNIEGDCLEAPGSETINGGQDEVIEQMASEMASMRTTASPLSEDPAILNAMPPPPRPNLPGPNSHMTLPPSQPRMAPRPDFVDPAIMSMGSMPLPPPPQRAMFPAGPPPAPAPQSKYFQFDFIA